MYELRAYAIEDCYKSIIGNISEVTCQDIAAINRDKLKLCSNLKLESSSSYYDYIENENYNVKKECNVNNSSDIDDNILSVYEVKVESDVKRDDSSDIEFGNDQIFVGPLETTKIKLTEIKFENDIANNEDLLALEYGDDQVLAIPLKRRKVQKIKNVTGTSVIKTQKQSSKNGNLKEETTQSLNERTILPLHDTVQKTTKLKKKYQVSSWNKGIKKQKSTYCNELTPEEKNMKGVLTVRILTPTLTVTIFILNLIAGSTKHRVDWVRLKQFAFIIHGIVVYNPHDVDDSQIQERAFLTANRPGQLKQ
ncbi:hypothetical protein EVAR_92683_1 [Eumeta japonica]|uniref:Uncharacterized protein n=1 Tax=Eumeta variegata TaxID=151549 RepID=A0A4C1SXU8_EUMVA|nr:hypothetical protein EVAR_92683_1 [Eumeta japonica]